MNRFASLRLPILLLATALVGAAMGTATRQEAAMVSGTYYVDLFRAVDGSPGFAEAAAASMAPLMVRSDVIKEEEKVLEDAISALQLMDPDSLEFAQRNAQLQIQSQALNEEKKALVQLRDQVREQVMASVTLRVHQAVEQIAKVKGYEAVVLQPLPLSEVENKPFGTAMELLRQRSTLWIHPTRDITDEVIAVMAE